MAKVIKLANLASELKKQLNIEKQFIEDNAEKAVRVAAIKTFSKIIKMTPVGNPDLWKSDYKPVGYVGGRARSNWFLGSSLSDRTTEATQGKGDGYIASSMPNELMGNKTYFYNNLPYIQALEYGYSTQAPNGMVRVSLLGWDKALNKAFKALKWHT